MGPLGIILLLVFGAIVYNVFSGGGGAKSIVKYVFEEYRKLYGNVSILADGRYKMSSAIFNNEEQLKAFIFVTIFLKRISKDELGSTRCKIELDTHGKRERFEFEREGSMQWAELYNFKNLGDLICTIWYIESGLRASYYYGSFGGALDLPIFDQFSSKVVTREYEELCEKYGIDDTEIEI